LAAVGREMTRCAEVSRRREHGLQKKGKDDIAPRIPKGRTSRMKRWRGPECKIGIKDPDAREQLLPAYFHFCFEARGKLRAIFLFKMAIIFTTFHIFLIAWEQSFEWSIPKLELW
jgi:hypothetical protein